VDLISTFLPLKEFGAPMTISGIWQEKIKKFQPAGACRVEFRQTSAKSIKNL